MGYSVSRELVCLRDLCALARIGHRFSQILPKHDRSRVAQATRSSANATKIAASKWMRNASWERLTSSGGTGFL